MRCASDEGRIIVILALFIAALILALASPGEATETITQVPALRSVPTHLPIHALQEWNDAAQGPAEHPATTGDRPKGAYALAGGLALVFLVIMLFAMKTYIRL